MTKVAVQKPVFFIATKTRREPAIVNFNTNSGERVAFDAVKKVTTKTGVRYYATIGKRSR